MHLHTVTSSDGLGLEEEATTNHDPRPTLTTHVWAKKHESILRQLTSQIAQYLSTSKSDENLASPWRPPARTERAHPVRPRRAFAFGLLVERRHAGAPTRDARLRRTTTRRPRPLCARGCTPATVWPRGGLATPRRAAVRRGGCICMRMRREVARTGGLIIETDVEKRGRNDTTAARVASSGNAVAVGRTVRCRRSMHRHIARLLPATLS